jgi:hypothetical protein
MHRVCLKNNRFLSECSILPHAQSIWMQKAVRLTSCLLGNELSKVKQKHEFLLCKHPQLTVSRCDAVHVVKMPGTRVVRVVSLSAKQHNSFLAHNRDLRQWQLKVTPGVTIRRQGM